LKHFKLQITGNKAVLVDRLYSHLQMNTNNGQQVGGTQADATTNQQYATNNSQKHNPPPEQEQGDCTPELPQQMINQLATILQQAQNSWNTSDSDTAIEDDCLSAASDPVQQTNPPSLRVTVR